MTATHASPMIEAMKAAGGIVGDYHGRELVRHFGDPAGEYRAAVEGVAVFDRSHRTRLRVFGRAPAQMLDGVLTGTIPDAPEARPDGTVGGRATYHAVLTPKGKMLSDLWAVRLGAEEEDGFLLDVPVAGREPLLAHLKKFLPPRLASVEDLSASLAMIMVTGAGAAEAVSRAALGLRVEADELSALEEGELRAPGGPLREGPVVVRTGDVWPPAFNVVGPSGAVAALWRSLVAGGAVPAGLGVWQTLRVEAGRPAYGTDMDDATIPVEAAIHERAIDYQKGCYTGQEVIVRIRDRGHVNRTLRLVELGDVPTPAAGAELIAEGDAPDAKASGTVTSAVASPRFGQTMALAYVRRGVEGPLVLRPRAGPTEAGAPDR